MKLKTNKSLAKRVKITGSGLWKHSKTNRSHLLTNKGRCTHKNRFGKMIREVDSDKWSVLLPYGK